MFDHLYDAFQPVFSPKICLGWRVISHVVLLLLKWLMTSGGCWFWNIDLLCCNWLNHGIDSICHNFLLANLHAYGVSHVATEFLQSHLSKRQQRVKLVEFGLTGQLSYVELPLLFNIFINDLNFGARIASLRLYADDTTTYTSATNTTALELSFNQDIRKLSTSFSSNYLTL